MKLCKKHFHHFQIRYPFNLLNLTYIVPSREFNIFMYNSIHLSQFAHPTWRKNDIYIRVTQCDAKRARCRGIFRNINPRDG